MFFNFSSCPFGWSPLASADGRYIVGRTSGGVGVTAGTALSSRENRTVGRHGHTVNDRGHTHSTPSGVQITTLGMSICCHPHPEASGSGGTTGSANTNISVAETGSVDGTNAPYLQLLVCQKD